MIEQHVQDAIERVIRDRLKNKKILSVTAVRDEDFSGDAIISVSVVIDDDIESYDPKKLSGLIRHIRASLDSAERGFPLVSFMSATEARELAA